MSELQPFDQRIIYNFKTYYRAREIAFCPLLSNLKFICEWSELVGNNIAQRTLLRTISESAGFLFFCNKHNSTVHRFIEPRN